MYNPIKKIMLITFAFALLLTGCNINGMSNKKPSPSFELKNFEGDTVSLSDFEGKKVYIKFWASWCSVCLSTLAETDKLSSGNNAFEVITVVAPGYSGEKKCRRF